MNKPYKLSNKIETKNTTQSVIDTPNTQIHVRSLSWLDTCTSVKRRGSKIAVWTQTSPLSE